MKRGITVGAACAAIVAAVAGCSHDASKVSPSSSTSAARSSETPKAASDQQLQKLAADDRSFVSAQLADHWVAELSSKHATQPWTVDSEDNVTFDSAKILQEHQQLRQQYGAKLLRSGDWPAFDRPDYWVTIAPVGFSDSAGALKWCTSQNLDADHCVAQLLSSAKPPAGH